MTHAIEAEGLVKRFGTTTALAGIDLAAARGTVLGLLGPNGSGKTTAVRILATLLQAVPLWDPALLSEAVRRLDEAGIVAGELPLRRPSLVEVFLSLTGRRSAQGAEPEQREVAV